MLVPAPAELAMSDIVNLLEFRRFSRISTVILGLANAALASCLLASNYTLPLLGISDSQRTLVNSLSFGGMFVGAAGFGVLAERLGRKACLTISLGIAVLVTVSECGILQGVSR